MPVRTTRSEKLDLRLTHNAKRTLQAAAADRSVSQFGLESALARADETLAKPAHVQTESYAMETFVAALDAPPLLLPRLGCS